MFKAKESEHRVYGKHCSWHFYDFSLFQTCFIGFVTVFSVLKQPKQVFFNPIKYILTSFTHSVLLLSNLLFFVLTSKIYFFTVGFANPALYKWAGNQNIFNDITSGKNNCCAGGWSGSTVVCCPENGFYAVKGWDPVTGLGSINVGNLIAAWSALP